MILNDYALVGLVALLAAGILLLVAALSGGEPRTFSAPDSWKQYRFGFATAALVFLAFDMEMIFMYPWAVVFAPLGTTAFLDMFVFIALLGAGLVYAWAMGGLSWE